MRTSLLSIERLSLQSFFKLFAVVFIPLIIGVFSLIAIYQWPSLKHDSSAISQSFKVVDDVLGSYTPQVALERITSSPLVTSFETKRVESPFWILLNSPANKQNLLELPSRHAKYIQCYSVDASMTAAGNADRVKAVGVANQAKAGFSIEPFTSAQLLCKAQYKGPAQITVLEVNRLDLENSSDLWNRNAGLLEGGMLTLAAFVLVVAVINRNLTYFIFSLWLLFNYRLAAISAGWDFTWLSVPIPSSVLYQVRHVSSAVLYLLTVLLLTELLAEELKRISKSVVTKALLLSALILLVCSVGLSYELYLPVMWAVVGAGIVVMGYLLATILIKTRSRAAMWFAASMGVALLSSLYEIAAAAFGFRELIGAVNSVTSSLASSLLAAFAIAEHLRKARSDHVKTYRVSPVGLATIGTDGTLLRTNEAFGALAGRKSADGEAHWADYFPPEVLANMRDEIRGEDGPVEIVFSLPTKHGEHWFELTAISAGDGNVEAALNEITERKLANDRLHWLADHDPLTGLFNRRGLNTALSQAMTALSQSRKAALAYIDLNRFKLANDLYGHSTGDMLLKQVTDRLSQLMGPGETLARVGGDEFVIVFLDMPLARAKRRCEELLDAIAHPLYSLGSDGRSIRLSASLGLVEMSEGTMQDDVIATADQACRAAKRDSGAGLVVYQQESSAFGERLAELRLIKRLDASEDFSRVLRLNFQPLLKLSDPYATLDFEVLLRANDPSGMPIPAYRIINSAEKAGYMQRVDLWVLESTLRFMEAHPQEMGSTGLACVNLSGASLNDESFVANVGACLRNYPGVAKRICFEITEAVALHDLANTRRWIDQQRNEGAKVALDDFGAGYSSFAYLRELPADALKIDGAFVRSMARHPANQSIVQVIIDLAHNLGMSTVAECVEDLETMSMLWELGADYVQGFVLAKPMSGDELLRGNASWDLITDPHARKLIMDTSGVKPPPAVRLASGM
jgi:diguanylate cyclase (GGDEF)-like protein